MESQPRSVSNSSSDATVSSVTALTRLTPASLLFDARTEAMAVQRRDWRQLLPGTFNGATPGKGALHLNLGAQGSRAPSGMAGGSNGKLAAVAKVPRGIAPSLPGSSPSGASMQTTFVPAAPGPLPDKASANAGPAAPGSSRIAAPLNVRIIGNDKPGIPFPYVGIPANAEAYKPIRAAWIASSHLAAYPAGFTIPADRYGMPGLAQCPPPHKDVRRVVGDPCDWPFKPFAPAGSFQFKWYIDSSVRVAIDLGSLSLAVALWGGCDFLNAQGGWSSLGQWLSETRGYPLEVNRRYGHTVSGGLSNNNKSFEAVPFHHQIKVIYEHYALQCERAIQTLLAEHADYATLALCIQPMCVLSPPSRVARDAPWQLVGTSADILRDATEPVPGFGLVPGGGAELDRPYGQPKWSLVEAWLRFCRAQRLPTLTLKRKPLYRLIATPTRARQQDANTPEMLQVLSRRNLGTAQQTPRRPLPGYKYDVFGVPTLGSTTGMPSLVFPTTAVLAQGLALFHACVDASVGAIVAALRALVIAGHAFVSSWKIQHFDHTTLCGQALVDALIQYYMALASAHGLALERAEVAHVLARETRGCTYEDGYVWWHAALVLVYGDAFGGDRVRDEAVNTTDNAAASATVSLESPPSNPAARLHLLVGPPAPDTDAELVDDILTHLDDLPTTLHADAQYGYDPPRDAKLQPTLQGLFEPPRIEGVLAMHVAPLERYTPNRRGPPSEGYKRAFVAEQLEQYTHDATYYAEAAPGGSATLAGGSSCSSCRPSIACSLTRPWSAHRAAA